MTRAYDDEAMKPMPRLEPPRPWWFKWMTLAIFVASIAAGAAMARAIKTTVGL